MKVKRTLLAIGLFTVLQTVAFGQATNTVLSASTTSSDSKAQTKAPAQQVQPKLEPTYSTTQYQLVEPKIAGKGEKDKITRVGKESSRAWTTIVSQQPNPTLVHNLGTHEPSFALCSFGHKAW